MINPESAAAAKAEAKLAKVNKAVGKPKSGHLSNPIRMSKPVRKSEADQIQAKVKERFNTNAPTKPQHPMKEADQSRKYQDHLSNFRGEPPPPAMVGAKPRR